MTSHEQHKAKELGLSVLDQCRCIRQRDNVPLWGLLSIAYTRPARYQQPSFAMLRARSVSPMDLFTWAARPLHPSWVWPVAGTGRLESQERIWGVYSAASCLHPSAQLCPRSAPSGSGAMTVSYSFLSLVPTLFPHPCPHLWKESFYLKVVSKIPPKCTVCFLQVPSDTQTYTNIF